MSRYSGCTASGLLRVSSCLRAVSLPQRLSTCLALHTQSCRARVALSLRAIYCFGQTMKTGKSLMPECSLWRFTSHSGFHQALRCLSLLFSAVSVSFSNKAAVTGTRVLCYSLICHLWLMLFFYYPAVSHIWSLPPIHLLDLGLCLGLTQYPLENLRGSDGSAHSLKDAVIVYNWDWGYPFYSKF